jgi:hypothetical protein
MTDKDLIRVEEPVKADDLNTTNCSIKDLCSRLSRAYLLHEELNRYRANLAHVAFCDTKFTHEHDPAQPTLQLLDLHDQKMARRKTAIASNLDADSVRAFVEIVTRNHSRAAQAARADKRHAEDRDTKQQVFLWLDKNRHSYKSMNAAAQAITKLQPIAFTTAQAWGREWKKLQSAGRPYSLPVDGLTKPH